MPTLLITVGWERASVLVPLPAVQPLQDESDLVAFVLLRLRIGVVQCMNPKVNDTCSVSVAQVVLDQTDSVVALCCVLLHLTCYVCQFAVEVRFEVAYVVAYLCFSPALTNICFQFVEVVENIIPVRVHLHGKEATVSSSVT